ncbi:MAG: sulfur carrier protein ThiS [Bacillota bacterium]|nr:sulfur carrier protein ThiS [Bacillota bacterium]MDP4160610.1 sulfur carrier protein ThiS [Bacillota bacterium]
MQIVVNGQAQEIPLESTLFQLLQDNGVSLDAAVVELNGKILKQEQWQSTVLQPDDRLEILVFMGGG